MVRSALLAICLFFTSVASAQYSLRSLADAEAKSNSARLNPPTIQAVNNSDFVYQRCEWQVDPVVNYIDGKITTYFIPGSSISNIQFDLSVALTVDSIVYHSNNLVFAHAFNILDGTFPSALPANVIDSVSVYYHGTPDTSIRGFHLDVHGPNNDAVMWTLSEPYGAMNWWPCKQNLSDKIDSIDILVTAPFWNEVASNGVLVNDVTFAVQRQWTWKHRHPIPAYLVCFAVSNYSIFTFDVQYAGDTVQVINYVYPEDSAIAHFALQQDIVPQMLLFDTLFGTYPFTDEKYGHAQCNFGGGMEHTTITFLGGFWYELHAHELAHHWFGDKITCNSWEDIWLNEGFATYLSGLCYEHYTPTQYWYPWLSAEMNYVTSLPDGSVWVDDTTVASRIFDPRLSYAKGAMVLHQLRWVIGDSAWYAAVNAFLTNHAFDFASTSDLQTEFETASNQNLSWYFNDWFFGEGFPTYTIAWSLDTANVATVTIQQSQSDASVSFFELPLPLYFKNATSDTLIRVQHNVSGQSFTIPLSFAPDSLIFDPYLWIITDSAIVNNVPDQTLPVEYFTLYPNPTSDVLIFKSPLKGRCTVKIYDMQGKLVLIQETSADGSGRGSVNLATLNAGYYNIYVVQEGREYKSPLLKK
jgi:hypothetical protein